MLYFFDKVYRDCWLDEMIEFSVRESCDTLIDLLKIRNRIHPSSIEKQDV